MQIKNTMKSHLIPTSMATIGNSSNPKYFRGYIAIGVCGSSGRVDSWQTIKYYLEIRMTGTPFNVKSFLGMCPWEPWLTNIFTSVHPNSENLFSVHTIWDCHLNFPLEILLQVMNIWISLPVDWFEKGIESQHRLKLFFNNLRS